MNTKETTHVIKNLGAGLVLRRSSVKDLDAIARLNARVHSDDGPDKPDERLAAWTQDLIARPHPTSTAQAFTVVEDTTTGHIVSTLCLIPQTWSYEGIEFKVGRPELVGTEEDFRNRGLVRAQFEEIHRWSAECGDLLQAITGIPYYYRLFGYEMCLNLGGSREGFEAQVPTLEKDQKEPYLLRPAASKDLNFIVEVYNRAHQRYPIWMPREKTLWEYELDGQLKNNVNRSEMRIIETPQGEPVGYLLHPFFNWGDKLAATGYELKAGVSWLAVTPSVVRYLWKTGGDYATKEKPRNRFMFSLGEAHPVYEILGENLPKVIQPYSWYLRVPDLPAFLEHIRPALEQRLEESLIPNHSGEIKISFYNSGLHLKLEQGKLTGIETWQPTPKEWGQAAFPNLTFLQMVFGYRNFSELERSFTDCWWENEEHRVLLDALFPRKPTNLLPLS
ncbi:MAG: GNAT family N-acetyltransferase [Anaerolineales bacterium]|nr:GNAT family N-acetyltransferase [Anaerolineales bacterium]